MDAPKVPIANDILLAHTTPKQEPKQEVQSSAPVKETSPEVPNKVEGSTIPATEVPATEEFNINDWDENPTLASAPATTESTTANVKDVPVVTTKVEKETPIDPLEGVPAELKKAVELAKKGADYKALLKISQVDYTNIDPIQLFEQSVKAEMGAEAQEYLDSLTPLQKKHYGIEKRNQIVNWQKQQLESFEAQVAQMERQRTEAKSRADQALKETLNKVDTIAGLTIKPHHRQDIYDAITSGRMQQELFFDKKSGEYDYQSMIETYFVKKNLPKILDHVKKLTSSETQRRIVKDMSNVQLNKPGEAPAPVVEPKKTQQDLLMSEIDRMRGGARK